MPTPLDIARNTRLPEISPTPAYGEIWHVAADPDHPSIGNEMWSDRPALIISNPITNKHSGVVSVVYLTTSQHKSVSPVHIEVDASANYHGSSPKRVLALCEQIHTVSRDRLKTLMWRTSCETMDRVRAAVALSLGYNPNTPIANVFAKWERHLQHQRIDLETELVAMLEHAPSAGETVLRKRIALLEQERDAWRDLYQVASATEETTATARNSSGGADTEITQSTAA